jgi:serine/threonine protein kinase
MAGHGGDGPPDRETQGIDMGEAPPPQPPSGTVLKSLGGFELIAKVGQGGMGAVFKARQKSLDRIVALKVLPPGIAKDHVFIERFVREARSSAKLNHPNVVGGIDVAPPPDVLRLNSIGGGTTRR